MPNQMKKLIKFEFRAKERYGWTGHSKAYFSSGRELIIDRSVRMQLKPIFQLKRCLFCIDRLNQLADISFGDCYVEGKGDFYGRSSVIIRTTKGNDIFGKYSHLFTLERESIEAIRKSQFLANKKDNLEYAKIFIKKSNVYPNTSVDYETNKRAARRLLILEKFIGWGKNYNLNKARLYLLLSRAVKKLRTVGKMTLLAAVLGSAVVKDIFSLRRRKGDIPEKSAKGNIILVGYHLFNLGCQAMTFTTVDQMKRRFPNKNIYLFSSQDFYRIDKEKSIYTFSILPWDLDIKLGLLDSSGILLRKMGKTDSSEQMANRIREVIKNTDFFIDISGYALSSQWDVAISIHYLLNIIIAKKFSVPFYGFPQSVGPFDYSPLQKMFLYPLMKLYLPYPERIFIREDDGLKWVGKFTKKNVERSYDIVLTNKEYNFDNIYKEEVDFKNREIEPHSVGVIPNIRVLERTDRDSFYSMYCSLIERVLDAQKIVYLLRHAHQDLGIIEDIKSFFPDQASVRLIPDYMNVSEVENVIKQFDFIISSRYHSIVHAYKNGVPAIAIGWAIKYSELLDNFNQGDYCFDVRNNVSTDEIVNKLDKLIHNYKHEREKIIDKVNMLHKSSIFGIFGSDNC